jgi:hypothetical protein
VVASVHVRTIRPESGQTANRRVVPYPQHRCVQRRVLRDQRFPPRALLQHFPGKHSAGRATRSRHWRTCSGTHEVGSGALLVERRQSLISAPSMHDPRSLRVSAHGENHGSTVVASSQPVSSSNGSHSPKRRKRRSSASRGQYRLRMMASSPLGGSGTGGRGRTTTTTRSSLKASASLRRIRMRFSSLFISAARSSLNRKTMSDGWVRRHPLNCRLTSFELIRQKIRKPGEWRSCKGMARTCFNLWPVLRNPPDHFSLRNDGGGNPCRLDGSYVGEGQNKKNATETGRRRTEGRCARQ